MGSSLFFLELETTIRLGAEDFRTKDLKELLAALRYSVLIRPKMMGWEALLKYISHNVTKYTRLAENRSVILGLASTLQQARILKGNNVTVAVVTTTTSITTAFFRIFSACELICTVPDPLKFPSSSLDLRYCNLALILFIVSA